MLNSKYSKIKKYLIDNYGITRNLEEAGFILPDGTMIDLKRTQAPGKMLLHEDVACELRDAGLLSNGYVETLLEFGIMRTYGYLGAQFVKEPTEAQYDILYKMKRVSPELVIDIYDEPLLELDEHTSPREMILAIMNHYGK